jgi:antitoxin component YwqK of YwqJK toxin-antitoxin module
MSTRRVHFRDITRDDSGTYVYVDGAPFTGEVFDTGVGDIVSSVNTYVDGLEDGPQREFYYDGSPRAAYEVADGHVVGEAREWHHNGRLARLRVFNDIGWVDSDESWDEDEPVAPGEPS